MRKGIELKHGNWLKIADSEYPPNVLVHLSVMSEFKWGDVFPLKVSPCVLVLLQQFNTCRNRRLLSKRPKANHPVDSKLELELKFHRVFDNGSKETARLPNRSIAAWCYVWWAYLLDSSDKGLEHPNERIRGTGVQLDDPWYGGASESCRILAGRSRSHSERAAQDWRLQPNMVSAMPITIWYLHTLKDSGWSRSHWE